VLQRGVAAGEFRKGLDLDIVIDGFYGPIYYRLLIPYADLLNPYVESLATNSFQVEDDGRNVAR
jgi:Tetracyclin repressor-like, C-terminal domain